MKKLREGVYTSESMPQKVDAKRVAEILNRAAVQQQSAEPSAAISASEFETLWNAVSKLESQVCRNPDLPPVYKQIVSDAFEVLRNMRVSRPSTEGWVRVEDGLPELVEHWGGTDRTMYGSSAPVLAFSDGVIWQGYYYKSGRWGAYSGEHLQKVTHWRPLPAPPQSTPQGGAE